MDSYIAGGGGHLFIYFYRHADQSSAVITINNSDITLGFILGTTNLCESLAASWK